MTRGLAVLVATLAVPAWVAAQEPLLIHFTPGTAKKVTREEDQQLEATFRDAQKAAAERESALKKQHGKNQETWPEAARDELRLARDAVAQTQTDWFYFGIAQKDIDESLQDITGKMGEKTTLRMVPTAAEADFEVLVIGRGKVARDLGWGGNEAAAEIAMRVGAGGRLDGAALAKSGAAFRAKKSVLSRAGAFTIHDYAADAPYWLLVSRKPMVGFSFPWKGAAGQAADAFERFAAENADRIAAARTTRQ